MRRRSSVLAVSGSGEELGRRLRAGDLSAAPAVLNLVESTAPAHRDEIAALMQSISPAALGGEARAHLVGVTGPPGSGKSSLLAQLIRSWRADARTVAVLAVDPSSKRSGGALLGDPRAVAAAFDVVVIETVGVGQSETEVAEVTDTVAVVVQPGSGDVLQFLKSGIMEIPDVLVVTKSDLGQVAMRSRRDLNGALRSLGERDPRVVAVSSIEPVEGFDDLVAALDEHRDRLDIAARRLAARRASALADFAAEHGQRGLRALGGRRAALKLLDDQDAALDVLALTRALEAASAA